jgi:hypothetical protein
VQDLRLVTIDYTRLSRWLALERSSSDRAALLKQVLADAHPVPSAGDAETLQVLKDRKMPVKSWLGAALRTSPQAYLKEATAVLSTASPEEMELRFQDLARAGDDYHVLVDPDVLLGYFSQHYRIALNGMAGVGDTRPRYDGDPVLVEAMNWRPYPLAPTRIAYSPPHVQDIARRLAAFNDSAYPQGDLEPLFEYVEDFVDRDLFRRQLTLKDAVLGELESLREFYQDAAGLGSGVLVLPPG